MSDHNCTCCHVHRQGVHRELIVTPERPEVPATKDVRQADRRLQTAVAAETEARQKWEIAARSAQNYESGLRRIYAAVGIERASKAERRELQELQDRADGAFEVFTQKATECVEARQVQAAATHRESQQIVERWGAAE